ncbi:MerR family transcriptional regulator [bacterium]|nr:MerR family transcriptional regulator [bacterium]
MANIEKNEPFYQISQVSKLIGISSDRLRTYEEEGLIKPYRINKTSTGKRLYSRNEIEWLEIIRELIKLGVTIPVIRIFIASKFPLEKSSLFEIDKKIIKLILKLQAHPVRLLVKQDFTKIKQL